MDPFEKLRGDNDEELPCQVSRQNKVLRVLSLTYLWALFVYLPPVLVFGWFNERIIVLGYPLTCGLAGFFLMERQRTVQVLVNFAFGMIWFGVAALAYLKGISTNLWR